MPKQCKFGADCTRADCWFEHPPKPSAPPPPGRAKAKPGRGGRGGRGGQASQGLGGRTGDSEPWRRGQGGRRGRGRGGGRGRGSGGGAQAAGADSPPPPSYNTAVDGDDTLMAAMEAGMAASASPPPPKKKQSNTSLINSTKAMLAEDEELAADIEDPEGTLTAELVTRVAQKVGFDVDRVVDLIRHAQEVALCFVVDTTGSMGSLIEAVKKQIIEVVGSLEGANCGLHGLAFIGYKDYGSSRPAKSTAHIEVMPFKNGANQRMVADFQKFVGGLTATGGHDTPEDVLGGLEAAVNLAWPDAAATRVLVHIGDAPPHGSPKFHDSHDNYPDGHPGDLPLPELFGRMREKKIQYHFGALNNSCKKMVQVFEEFYGDPINSFDSRELSTLHTCVTETVMESVAATSGAVAARHGRARPFEIVKAEPRWSDVPVLRVSYVTYELPPSMEHVTNMKPLVSEFKWRWVQVADKPFDKGSIRLAYYGRRLHPVNDDSDPSADSYRCQGKVMKFKLEEDTVFKEYLTLPTRPELDRPRYEVDLEMQTIAAFFANAFNYHLTRAAGAARIEPIKLKFLMARVMRIENDSWRGGGERYRYMAVEKRFRDRVEMVKLTNNWNFTRGSRSAEIQKYVELATAFSHFTHVHSEGYLCVVDLQGIITAGESKGTLLLTDPAIHCAKHMRFGRTNLRQPGIDAFYKGHAGKCNQYCRALGLPPA